MKMLAGIARELIGLFVDDGMLAVALIAVIVIAAIVASLTPGTTAGVVLLAGSLFVLFANVMAEPR
ncbi:MAG: hypothetical protein E6H47_13335 [Betaproteobacteria bacterium]|nr:MAG: hypothetical protein E6H47_13335 [Betaproteobacteria bacterium]